MSSVPVLSVLNAHDSVVLYALELRRSDVPRMVSTFECLFSPAAQPAAVGVCASEGLNCGWRYKTRRRVLAHWSSPDVQDVTGSPCVSARPGATRDLFAMVNEQRLERC